jgi:hypothetical protein
MWNAARYLLVPLACAPTCKKSENPGVATTAVALSRRSLDVAVAGISGMARDEAGVIWLAPERDRVLVALEPSGALRTVPLEGVPDGLDVESLAYLGDGTFALGTESNVAPSGSETGAHATIYLARREAERVVITEPVVIDMSMWGMILRENQGVEGLCRAGRFLLAGIETVIERDGYRVAPIGLYDLERRRWQPLFLRLTTRVGSLSALACRLRDDTFDVVAIERHFGVSRILRFRVREGETMASPTIVADLDAFVAKTPLNFEAIELGEGGAVELAVDNQYRRITGPNELATIEGVAP